MNPEAMNRGYLRIAWGTFFLMIFPGANEASLPNLPGIIGLCLMLSGTGIVCGSASARGIYGAERLRQARAFTMIGIAVWVLQWPFSIFFDQNGLPWETRFLSYMIGAVIMLRIYVNVLKGGGELLEGAAQQRYSRNSGVFAAVYTLSVIGRMLSDLLGTVRLGGSGWGIEFSEILCLLLGIWTIWQTAALRPKKFL